MPTAPRIELDSAGPAAVDGRHIRALTFQSVRLEYLRQVLSKASLAAAGSRALVIGSSMACRRALLLGVTAIRLLGAA